MRWKVYHKLSAISPLTYLVAYLILVPAFALIYYFLPGQQFYAPYAKFEPKVTADSDGIKAILQRAIRTSVHPTSTDDWFVAPENIILIDFVPDDRGKVTLTFVYWGRRVVGTTRTVSVFAPITQITVDPKPMLIGLSPTSSCHLVTVLPQNGPGDQFVPDTHSLFHAPLPLRQPMICLDQAEEPSYQALLGGWSGNPRRLKGFGSRMLYFSATTLTTIGFGDIVPLTDESRLASGLEGVMGWIFAGLFLNALTNRLHVRISQTSNQKPTDDNMMSDSVEVVD